jgi:hypothetical protein
MARRVWRLALVVVLLLVVGAVMLALTTRPRLDDDRSAVDHQWTPLRAPLVARYDKLTGATAAFIAAGGGDRAITKDLLTTLKQWAGLHKVPSAKADAAKEATTADDLEGLGRRLRATISGSDRFRSVAPVTETITAFESTIPPPAAVKSYNDAVTKYEHARRGLLHRIVADTLGYGSRPVLEIGG